MPFQPTAHAAYCWSAILYLSAIPWEEPAGPVPVSTVATLESQILLVSNGCRQARADIHAMGHDRHYNPAYLVLLETFWNQAQVLMVGIAGKRTDSGVVRTAMSALGLLVGSVRDPFNMNIPFPLPVFPPTPPEPQFTPQPQWMQDMGTRLAGRMLCQVVMPGTHDSGTFPINHGSVISGEGDVPSWVDFVRALPLAGDIAGKIVANWARTQGLSIARQLEAGIRFLDFRVVENGSSNDFWLAHTMYGVSLADALSDLTKFMAAHPKEIIIINVAPKRVSSINSIDSLASKLIAGELGNRILPPSIGLGKDMKIYAPQSTIQSIWEADRQLIVIFEKLDQVDNAYKDAFWDSSNLNDYWPNTTDIKRLQDDLHGNLVARTTLDKLFVSQGVLTPNAKMIANGLAVGLAGPQSLYQLGQSVTPKVAQWSKTWAAEKLNLSIVMVDWFTVEQNFVPDLIALNQK
ncbi:MAG: hypothetical protein JWO51_2174 [Rhodospirillales bacterium]|nr:hypothetical protein [Rhodospirillales bacterium]